MKTLTLDSNQTANILVALYNYKEAYETTLAQCEQDDYRHIADCKATIESVNSILAQLKR